MLRIITGSFHPDLEHALSQTIRQVKGDDPFAPLAVLVPSKLLVARLLKRLVGEDGQALLNVSFLTFHQLALRLYEEQCLSPNDGHRGWQQADDFFFRHLLRVVARRGFHDGLGRALELPPGGCAALWATIRDLKDSAIDPAIALRAVDEGVFGAEDRAMLHMLFRLYAVTLDHMHTLGVGTAEDVAAAITPSVARSHVLSRFKHLYYYGFYDLTQVQLSFLEAVAGCCPVTVLFPLSDEPAFAFARRFLERHLLPLLPPREQIIRAPEVREEIRQLGLYDRPGPHVQVISTVGPEDEIVLVCKEILQLVESHGYRFDEIGVVARSLAPYQSTLRRSFDGHCIPFTSTAVTPAIHEPAVKILFRLTQLLLSNFAREPMLDVLTSRFYRMPSGMTDGSRHEPRPDLWRLVVASLGIRRGAADWERLHRSGAVEVRVGGGENPDDPQAASMSIADSQIRLLWRLVSRLIEDCRELPPQGSVAELTEAFVALATKHLTVPLAANPLQAMTPEDESSQDIALQMVFHDLLAQLRQLERLTERIDWAEWTTYFTQAVEETTIPIAPERHQGVRVLDAMAARGLPFRALFVLGLNEKVFPRYIREDAFLRDHARRTLNETLGYKIDEKLAGYDEETLLFALLRRAARDRLYLLYQRADVDGRPLAASPYLAEYRLFDLEAIREQHVPRRLSERLCDPRFAPPLLTPEELALALVLQGHDPSGMLEANSRGALFRNGLHALKQLEGRWTQLGAHDGLVGPHVHWEQLTSKGFAPTPLEQYARCPFQYFAHQVLRLEPRLPPLEELSPRAMGDLCHRVLSRCYPIFMDAGWPDMEWEESLLQKRVSDVAEEVFRTYAAEQGTGYPLLWDLARETVIELTTAVLKEDQQELRANGYRPLGCEMEADGTMEGFGPEFGAVKVRGRLDRVDHRAAPPGLRIIDFKFRQGREMKSRDRDLLTAAIRGMCLQPPLYTAMTVQDRLPDQVEFRFLAPNWRPMIKRSIFEATAWHGTAGAQLRRSFKILLDGLRAGRYFMLPGDHCDFCEVAVACRRFHNPSWTRVRLDGSAKVLRRLRQEKACCD